MATLMLMAEQSGDRRCAIPQRTWGDVGAEMFLEAPLFSRCQPGAHRGRLSQKKWCSRHQNGARDVRDGGEPQQLCRTKICSTPCTTNAWADRQGAA